MSALLRSLAAALLLLSWQGALAQFQNAPPADGVLGQPDFVSNTPGLSASMFNGPNGVAVDPATGKLFVADRGNHRVLRFSSTQALQTGGAAEAVFGQPDFTSNASGLAADRLNNPIGVHVGPDGALWVADFSNNRVLRFDDAATKPSGAAADGVLGQPDFTSGASGTSATEIRGPVTAFADDEGSVWITEFSNHRVTRFDDAADKPNGAAADGVIGQPDFTSGSSGLSASALSSPNASYVDAEGRLWVSDNGNRRVLRFDDAADKPDGADADGVLGQPDFTTNESNVTQAGMTSLRFVYGDDEGRLFVVQEGSHRITIYENAATLPNGAPADYVWGQPDFTTGTADSPPDATSFNTPRAIYVDDARDHVWVADWRNHRVLRFDTTPAEETALVLIAPNGGESIPFGTAYPIQWSSQNVDDVEIEYSDDDGETWTSIATVPAEPGQYSWTAPSEPTDAGRIRITDTSDPSLQDVSEAAFSIAPPDEVVTLVSPNGYQRWVAGTDRAILFTAQDVSAVDLAFSLNGGASWTTIAAGVAASSGSYAWTLPEVVSADALVRVSKAGDLSVADVSDAPFTLAAEPLGHPQNIVFFAGSATGGFSDPSYAAATAPSSVDNQNTKLPLSSTYAYLDNYALRLSWTSAPGGDWGAAVASPGFRGFDITLQDTLTFAVFTEEEITADELPVLFVEDLSNRRSPELQLSDYTDGWETGGWNRVYVPVAAFEANPGTTDLTRVKTVFFGQDEADNEPHTVYLDDVRFTGGEIISGEDRPVIVVIGSSTAAGTGASTPDSSWVGRYRDYVQDLDEEALVINLAVGGFTTYDVMPTGFEPPPGRPAPKPNNNITYALQYQPTAVIVNLPSNDAATGVPVADQLANFRRLQAEADAEGVPIWFSTTQPRNFADAAQRDELRAVRDSILAEFAPRAIDFYTGIATEDGLIDPAYNSGDGIHLNNSGHRILFERVVEAEVFVPDGVGVEDETGAVFGLDQNYPNPFAHTTAIRFSVPTSTARVSLDVYDLLGRHVGSLARQPREAGTHLVEFDASALASGVYLYRLEADGQALMRRMTVVR